MALSLKDLGFDWDDGNIAKCQKHGLSMGEIELLFACDPMVVLDHAHSVIEERLLAIGRGPSGRMMFVGFTIRVRGDRRLVRPITARYMREKEVRRYAQTST